MFVILKKDDCLALSSDISVFLQSPPKGGGCLFFVPQGKARNVFQILSAHWVSSRISDTQ